MIDEAKIQAEIAPFLKKKEGAPIYAENKHTIDDAETELRLMRLDLEREKVKKEMENLKAPTGNLDYMRMITDLIKQNADIQMKANEQFFNLRLEMEKIRLSNSDDGFNWVSLIERFAPMLLSGKVQQQAPMTEFDRLYSAGATAGNSVGGNPNSALNSPADDTQGGAKMEIEKMTREEIIQAVKEKKITSLEVWQSLCLQAPEIAAKIGKAKFLSELEKAAEEKE